MRGDSEGANSVRKFSSSLQIMVHFSVNMEVFPFIMGEIWLHRFSLPIVVMVKSLLSKNGGEGGNRSVFCDHFTVPVETVVSEFWMGLTALLFIVQGTGG